MSVRKRKWKTRSSEDREAWLVDYTDGDGDRHIRTFSRKKEADAYAATVTVSVACGVHTPDSKSITVAEAGRKWIETGENAGLERTTLEQYEQHLKFHIIPYLGGLKLSQVTLPVVRDFEDKLRAGKPASGEAQGTKRSPAMVRKVISSVGSILADAQERGLVAQNVVRSLRSRRKRGKERQAEKRVRGKLKIGVDIPTMDEMKAIVDHLEGRWRPFLLTAIFTGLRGSELRGLRWEDVDFKRGLVHVRQRADRYGEIGPPKSHAGERTVPLLPMVTNALRELKLRRKGDLVFANGKGNIEYHANILNRALIPVQVAAGVVDKDGNPKYTGLHALRHWYASWLINRKSEGGRELPVKVVQSRLGHSSITMTMDTYGHLFPGSDSADEQAEAERAFLG